MIQSVFNRALIAAAAISTLVLSGCSSVPLDESVKAGTTRAEADAAAGGGRDAAAAALQQKSIYFDFDSYSVKPVYLPVIEAHARNLISNSAMHIVIEGNTDSRGSREYNLALGQRRSEAVKQRMQLLGVPADRIESVSFGREKPVAQGENEEAWAKNRRADIVYR